MHHGVAAAAAKYRRKTNHRDSHRGVIKQSAPYQHQRNSRRGVNGGIRRNRRRHRIDIKRKSSVSRRRLRMCGGIKWHVFSASGIVTPSPLALIIFRSSLALARSRWHLSRLAAHRRYRVTSAAASLVTSLSSSLIIKRRSAASSVIVTLRSLVAWRSQRVNNQTRAIRMHRGIGARFHRSSASRSSRSASRNGA